ncbi:MAG: glycosyltransferase [Verrucomicrobiae bacterium]|nr:glycosyltransferase [Verrucomicrobiae bacterium]
MKPLVSVIIPTHNRKRLLAEAVDSVLAQTVRDLEVIVVDDGSTDGTGDSVRERYDREPRVRYIWQANAERAVARNRGITAAQGEFLAFLDSDDAWLPQKLEKQLPLFTQDSAVDLVHSGYAIIDEKGVKVRDFVLNEGVAGDIFLDMIHQNQVGSPTAIVRRRAIERAGVFCVNPALLTFEDWEFWTRVCYRSRAAYIAEPLALYRMHGGNTERPLSAVSYRAFLREILRYVSEDDRPKVAQVAARRFLGLVRRAEGQRNLREAWRTVFIAVGCLGCSFVWRHLLSSRRLLADLLLGRKVADILRVMLGRPL